MRKLISVVDILSSDEVLVMADLKIVAWLWKTSELADEARIMLDPELTAQCSTRPIAGWRPSVILSLQTCTILLVRYVLLFSLQIAKAMG